MKAGPSENKRKTADPSYDAHWWHFYEQTKDVSNVILSGRCKIKNYKDFYIYSKLNGLSAFKNMLINMWQKMKNHKINQTLVQSKAL
jgi:hypothetical protein